MATSTLKQLPKATIELEISIPWSDVKVVYDRVFDSVVDSAELPGFRKGKAPRDLVEKHADKSKIYEQVVRELIPSVYAEALKTHDIKPVISPRVEIVEAHEGKDWKIKASAAEKPKVDLKNYKSAIAKAKGKVKTKLWVPGQSPEKEEKKEDKDKTLDEVIRALLEETEIEISDLLVQDEVNRMLSRLVDQTQKLGLTVEQYLVAQGKTSEQLREEYRLQATNALKLEYVLEAVSEAENITVTGEEIENMIKNVKDAAEQQKLRANSYYIASLIRQQKTLDTLTKPVV